MLQYTIENLYDLNETIAAPLFEGAVYPWELLPKISDFIKSWEHLFPQINIHRSRKMYGYLILQRSRLQHILADRPS